MRAIKTEDGSEIILKFSQLYLFGYTWKLSYYYILVDNMLPNPGTFKEYRNGSYKIHWKFPFILYFKGLGIKVMSFSSCLASRAKEGVVTHRHSLLPPAGAASRPRARSSGQAERR